MTEKQPIVPGIQQSLTSKILETGGGMFQSKAPLNPIHTHLCGIVFFSGDVSRQIVVHKYGAFLNEDFSQFLLYDSDDSNAHLLGIEYVVHERLFKSFPEEEKQLWHSLYFEVKSGILMAPRLPGPSEDALMRKFVESYAKTFILWAPDKSSLPYGVPQLAMGFTDHSQVDVKLLLERDRLLGINSEDKKKERLNYPIPALDPKVDSLFKQGEFISFEIKTNKLNPK